MSIWTYYASYGTIPAMKLKNLLAVAAASAAFAVNATSLVEIADNSTVTASQFSGWNGHTDDTASKEAKAEYTLRFGGGVTIELDPSAAVDGVFTLCANIWATNGSFTVDATGIEAIRWVGALQTSGKVTVKGAKEVRFGELTAPNATRGRTNFPYFKTDMEFENPAATGLVFTNTATCAKLPTSCSWSIADNTRFAIDANGLLGGGDETFTLDKYDITLIDCDGINAGKIIVGSGRTLEIIQCQRTEMLTSGSNIYRWTWAGSGYQHVTNDIEFVSGSALYVFGGQHNLHFDGNVSGSPAATFAFSTSGGTAFFAGGVPLGGTLLFNKNNTLSFKGNGPFSLGDVTVGSGLSAAKLSGNGSATLSVGAVSGTLNVEGFSLDVRESAADGATLNLCGSGPWTVKGPASGEPANLEGVLVPAASGGEIAFGGLLKLGNLGTTFSSITLLDGAVLTDTTIDPSVKISGAGRVVQAGTSWKEKIYFWGDAQASSSVVLLTNHWDLSGSSRLASNAKIVSGGPDYPLVWQWDDCRGASAGFAIRSWRCTVIDGSTSDGYNSMASDPRPTYPFYAYGVDVSESARDYISFAGANPGSRQATLIKSSGSGSWIDCEEPTAYAIVVFGSQQGGGAGILGSKSSALARTYSKSEAAASNPIFSAKNYATFTNGVAVADSSVTGFSGGWQIISIDTENTSVSGIGLAARTSRYGSSASNRGYSNYAEVMLFKTAPTELERKVAEEYLAAKWGLPCAHSDTREPVELTLGLSGAPSGSALIEYPADDIPRALTINLDFGAGTVRGTNYPLVKCAPGDTFTLGTVTGSRRAEDVSLVYDSVTGTLNARIAETGLMLLIK